MSRSRARRCSATACGKSSPSRTCISRVSRESSISLLDQTDENLLQRTLIRLEIFERDARVVEVGEKVGYVHPSRLGVVGVDQLAAVRGQFQPVAGEFGRDLLKLGVQLQRQLFAAEFAHQLV